MNVPVERSMATTARPKIAAQATGALTVFLAALGPMMTVPAIRRLIVDGHGGSSASVHLFVAVGMIGAAIGAPLIAARVDAKGDLLRTAAVLASIDALVELATSSVIPTAVLFALRPVHGIASMGLLALLFARFRRSGGGVVAYAGSAMIAALAIGPAIGGILSRTGPSAPFRAAAVTSAALALLLVARSDALSTATTSVPRPSPRGTMKYVAKSIAAPLFLAATQRFAIGGFVAAFAVMARAVHGLSDARVGANFSTLLVVFALGMLVVGRARNARKLAPLVPAGAVLFGAAFIALAFAPRWLLPAALGAAGLGASLVYAPCLAIVSGASIERTRATSMALLHAAGAVGMIAGPLVAAAIDLGLRGLPIQVRCAVFLAFAGTIHAVTAIVISPRLRALADISAIDEASRNESIS